MKNLHSTGLSSIIATILMLTIVIALAGLAYLFIGGFFTTRTSTMFEVLDSMGSNITILNEGTANITSINARVDGQTVAATLPDGPILPGHIGIVTLSDLPPQTEYANYKVILASSTARQVWRINYISSLSNRGFEDTSLGTGNNVDVADWDTSNVYRFCNGNPSMDLDGGKDYSGSYGYGEEGCCNACEDVNNYGVGYGYIAQNASVNGGLRAHASIMARVNVYPAECENWDGDGTYCPGDQVCIGEDDSRIVLVAYNESGGEIDRKYSKWALGIRGGQGLTSSYAGWQKITLDWKLPSGTKFLEMRVHYADVNDNSCVDWTAVSGGNGAVYWDDAELLIFHSTMG